MKGREQKIILRVGRVLELVDEHDGIGGTQGAENMGPGPEQQFRDAVQHDEGDAALLAVGEALVQPAADRERRAVSRISRWARQADDPDGTRLKGADWKSGDLRLPFARRGKTAAGQKIIVVAVFRKKDVVGARGLPFLSNGGKEPIDEALGERIEGDRGKAPRLLGRAALAHALQQIVGGIALEADGKNLARRGA
jgi:hypothetical protein